MTSVIAVIPARMGSSRFPGKPLAPLLGRSMLEHVYRRTAACSALSETVIATCDEKILRAAEAFGARAVMTSTEHQRASDRVAEAVVQEEADVIVMVQGDEPMIHPDMITAAVEPMLEDAQVSCVNLAARIRTIEELRDPNTIKVVTNVRGDALFFSRQPVPTVNEAGFERGEWFKQVCVIPFRRAALERFTALPPTPLEVAESVDMLRFLEHGVPVRIVPTSHATHAVDTPQDLQLVEARLAEDPFTAAYMEVD